MPSEANARSRWEETTTEGGLSEVVIGLGWEDVLRRVRSCFERRDDFHAS